MEIGRGVQYKVIDIGKERVLKIPLTTEEAYAVVATRRAPNPISNKERLRIPQYRGEAIESCQIMQQLLTTLPSAGSLVGNPIFEEGGVYTQDKVTPLGNRLDTVPRQTAELLLGKYVMSNISCWEFGFAEHVFNFSVNNGTDADDNIVLMDFGEITTNYERVADAVTIRKWLGAYSYASFVDEELKAYYAATAEELLSTESLARSWRSAHPPGL